MLLWPIKVDGKTMPLLDITEYKNYISLWTYILYQSTGQFGCTDPASRLFGRVAVAVSAAHMDIPPDLRTKQTCRAGLVEIVEKAMTWLVNNVTSSWLANESTSRSSLTAARDGRLCAYCGLRVFSRRQTERKNVYLPGDNWLAVEDNHELILPNSLITDIVPTEACVARLDSDLLLLRQSI